MADMNANADSMLPIVDFAPFLLGSASERRKTAEAITNGFETAGFIYLSNFGNLSLIEDVFASSARIFALPQVDKDNLAIDSIEVNCGYVALGREKLSEAGHGHLAGFDVRDLKESFEIGREGDDQEPNKWYDEQFKEIMCKMFDFGHQLHVQLLRAIAIGLNVEDTFFDAKVNKADDSLRLLHYPSVSQDVFAANNGQLRAGTHSDYGSLTILFQDNQGGLQVKSASGKFINVLPIAGTAIVNAGDLLARWSNDIFYFFFGLPNLDAWIKGIPGTIGEGMANKYKGVASGDYLKQRLRDTHDY